MYLKNSTTAAAASSTAWAAAASALPVGGERPALTAAAIAWPLPAGEYKDELVKKWFKYCKRAHPDRQARPHRTR